MEQGVGVDLGITELKFPQPEGSQCKIQSEETHKSNLYGVEDRLPWIFSICNAIQTVVCHVSNALWLTLQMTSVLCLLPADRTRVYLVSSALLVSGIVTCLQSSLGIRLPVMSVPSLLYSTSLITLPKSCPGAGDLYSMGSERSVEWQARLREVQGALLVAGITQALLGVSGLKDYLLCMLSPAVLAASVILAGFSVVQQPVALASQHWPVFIIVVFLMLFFALCLKEVHIPLPIFSLKLGLRTKRFPIFRMFPVLWTCVAAYFIFQFTMLTYSQSDEDGKKIERYLDAIDKSKSFYLPIPMEWGWPRFKVFSATHLLPALALQSVISVVLFQAAAFACGLRAPSRSDVGRGLAVEGLGLVVGSMWGNAVSTSPDYVGLMSFTGIASRSSTQLAGVILIILSSITGISVFLVNIPPPFLTSLHFCLNIGLVCVGISMLRLIKLSSSRDVAVVGFSLFLGLTVPQWVQTGVSVGFPALDSFLTLSISSPTIVGFLTGCFLELCLPGQLSRTRLRHNLLNSSSI